MMPDGARNASLACHLAAFLLALALVLLPWHAQAAGFNGIVVRVTDGDTVVVRKGGADTKVRMLGIDAPEHDQAPWGPRAAAFLGKLAGGKAVRIETDVQVRDRYGRLLGYLHVGSTFVNLELVRQGFAMLYTSPPNVAHAAEFLAAQREARAAGRNIWSATDGLRTSPYEWRHHRPPPRSIGQNGLPAGGEDGRPVADPPASAELAAAQVVGNRKSRKYHSATCPLAARIAPGNRIGFATREDAEAAGMRPCGHCRGRAAP